MWTREIEDAALSPFHYRSRAGGAQPRQRIAGAVYESGRLVDMSQRVGGLYSDHALSINAGKYVAPTEAERLPGLWLYGGTWFNHFGHFLTESVTTLWPERGAWRHHADQWRWEEFDGVLFHAFWFGHEMKPWQQEMLNLAGYGGLPVRVVADEPVTVDRLVVATRPFIPNMYALPAAVAVWRRMAEAVGEGHGLQRVFLSRRLVHEAERARGAARERRISDNEAELDALMEAQGYRVTYPETLPVTEQVRLVKDADIVAGVSGSGLHLSVFAPFSSRVLEIGDARNRDAAVRNQQVLCRGNGQRLGFIRHGEGTGFDLGRVKEVVVELG